LISAGNQQVGGIGGTGSTQVNGGASLTADQIVQRALVIGGTSGSAALVTIDASDSSGNPLGESSPYSSGLILAGLLDASSSMGFNGSSELLDGKFVGVAADRALALGDVPVSPAATVPEPSTLLLVLAGICGGLLLRRSIRTPRNTAWEKGTVPAAADVPPVLLRRPSRRWCPRKRGTVPDTADVPPGGFVRGSYEECCFTSSSVGS
jgi:PEP-CTERM motif